MAKYVLLRYAAYDLKDFSDFLKENNGLKVAHDFEETMFSLFDLLAEFPGIGRHRVDLKEGLYSFADKKYKRFIYYRITPLGITIS